MPISPDLQSPLSRLRERVRERADLASAALGSPLTVPLHRDSPEGRARGLSQGLPSPRPSPADGRGGKRSERSPPFLERRETSWDFVGIRQPAPSPPRRRGGEGFRKLFLLLQACIEERASDTSCSLSSTSARRS